MSESNPKDSWLIRLQKKWNLGSTVQVLIVLTVFALTGTTVMVIKPYVVGFFSNGDSPSILFTILYYILILPFYNLLLLIYGFLFGKFKFFLAFEKRFFKRLFRIK